MIQTDKQLSMNSKYEFLTSGYVLSENAAKKENDIAKDQYKFFKD